MDRMGPTATGSRRIGLLLGGFGALVLAVVGAILPIMPTTPFILLALYCFARSSTRWYVWLTTNRLFGRYAAHAAQGSPLSWQTKTALVASCWVTAAPTALLLAPNLAVRISSLSIAALMTGFVLLRGRRRAQPLPSRSRSELE